MPKMPFGFLHFLFTKPRVIQKNFFGHYAGGEGFLAFFWSKFTKNVAGEGGGGMVKMLKNEVNLHFL
jgi:hypothetical protein